MDVTPDERSPLDYVIVADAVIVNDSSQIAMVRNRGRWWLPGGRVERGESIFEAARREVAEETGLQVDPIRIVALTERLTERHEIFVTVECALVAGNLRPPDGDAKIDAAKWTPLIEADDIVDHVSLGDLLSGDAVMAYLVERPGSVGG